MNHQTFVEAEIASQPQTWRQAAQLAPSVGGALPQDGQRVAVVGCGTSWFIAQAYAVLRESAGHGVTDAFAGSEFPAGRDYDFIVAITRSGTTTEIIDLVRAATDTTTVVLTAVPTAEAARVADHVIDLSFADEQSVVQTRFATTALALLRAHLGTDIEPLAADAEQALTIDVADLATAEQVSFLGRGWTIGLANEAALKAREAAQFWTEAYPAMDYRHGPIAIAEEGRLVWMFGQAPAGLDAEVAARGALFVHHDLDPMAALIVAQRFAVALAVRFGLDPDRPRALTRSVILQP
ncbi:SIS domain-containing protein [Demequina sp.]|uniref:SIS domain-containing protein n=1 Tax=Demequina sp. TaxID=2050685 RepID=UPI003A86660F